MIDRPFSLEEHESHQKTGLAYIFDRAYRSVFELFEVSCFAFTEGIPAADNVSSVSVFSEVEGVKKTEHFCGVASGAKDDEEVCSGFRGQRMLMLMLRAEDGKDEC